MAHSPTDLGKSFIEQGMRLITQPSSDALLQKASEKRKSVEESIRKVLSSDKPSQ